MKKIVTIIGLLVVQTMGLLFASEPVPRILGGEKVGTSGYEFFVSLMYKYEWDGPAAGHSWNPFCGASYIGGDLILTAAHCLNSIPRGATIGVLPGNRTGELKYEYCANENISPYQCVGLSSPDIQVSAYHYTGYLIYTGSESDVIPIAKDAETVAIHENYNSASLRNDIALIRLASSLPYPSIKLTDMVFSQLPSMATVVGHGNTRFSLSFKGGKPAANLQEVQLPLVSDTQCQTVYGDLHFPSMICAGYENGRDEEGIKKDSCQGDSGGPMFVDSDEGYELVGVVSYGDDCAVTYGVYTNVVNYRGWVEKKAAQASWESAGGGFPLSSTLLVLVFAWLRKAEVAGGREVCGSRSRPRCRCLIPSVADFPYYGRLVNFDRFRPRLCCRGQLTYFKSITSSVAGSQCPYRHMH